MKLEDLHSCEKSEGKLVGISVDKLGVTRCGYCHKVVNYKKFFELTLGDLDKMVIQ